MNELIKPKNLDEIIRSGIVLKSRKEYKDALKPYSLPLVKACSVRSKLNIHIPTSCHCEDNMCETCFLQANNYLNVLKYMKHNLKM